MSEKRSNGNATKSNQIERLADGSVNTFICTFSGGNDPCPTCPKKITALYKCKLLQDELENAETVCNQIDISEDGVQYKCELTPPCPDCRRTIIEFPAGA